MCFSDSSRTTISASNADEDTAMCGMTSLKRCVAHIKAGFIIPKRQEKWSLDTNPATVGQQSGSEKALGTSFIGGDKLLRTNNTTQAGGSPQPTELAQKNDSAVSGLGELSSERDEQFRRQIAQAWQRGRDAGWGILPGDEEDWDLSITPPTPTLRRGDNDIESFVSFDNLSDMVPGARSHDDVRHEAETASQSSGAVPEDWVSLSSGGSESSDESSEEWWSLSSFATHSAQSQPQHISASASDPVKLRGQSSFLRPMGAQSGQLTVRPVMSSVQQLELVVLPSQMTAERRESQSMKA
ncbi:hypothetical protein LTR36_000672 [Oleoguttula mirabilis]|uniref:Uncharacterized protein n=1 Tax=Oleoguttula mirabilis TaxID=1507867 RepID=A0AAV9JRV1_9PEZI|nr:hypothetical protein LTR36_000672 [Oleoguttula mirabilis]